jgi:hypothetical protein
LTFRRRNVDPPTVTASTGMAVILEKPLIHVVRRGDKAFGEEK